jgi:hypothetical protein
VRCILLTDEAACRMRSSFSALQTCFYGLQFRFLGSSELVGCRPRGTRPRNELRSPIETNLKRTRTNRCPMRNKDRSFSRRRRSGGSTHITDRSCGSGRVSKPGSRALRRTIAGAAETRLRSCRRDTSGRRGAATSTASGNRGSRAHRPR